MAYKDVEDRKAASKRHYYANKKRYLERNTRYRQEINAFIHELKESKPCVDCGTNYPYYVMDFDHLDDKEENISFLSATGRTGALKKELEKCELVCSNCHRFRTYRRVQQIKNMHP